MQIQQGIKDVPTAGTAVQLSTSTAGVYAIWVKGSDSNSARAYFGTSTVASTTGWTLQPGQEKDFHFYDLSAPGGSLLPLSSLYADADINGEDLEWIALTT